MLTVDSEIIAVIPPGRWVSVEEFGVRLTDDWPPPTLADVLDSLVAVLGGGHLRQRGVLVQVWCVEGAGAGRYCDLYDWLTWAALIGVVVAAVSTSVFRQPSGRPVTVIRSPTAVVVAEAVIARMILSAVTPQRPRASRLPPDRCV